ncbi:MAG: hypothetical protein AAF228_04490 [Pseudomonadota bacterium]
MPFVITHTTMVIAVITIVLTVTVGMAMVVVENGAEDVLLTGAIVTKIITVV